MGRVPRKERGRGLPGSVEEGEHVEYIRSQARNSRRLGQTLSAARLSLSLNRPSTSCLCRSSVPFSFSISRLHMYRLYSIKVTEHSLRRFTANRARKGTLMGDYGITCFFFTIDLLHVMSWIIVCLFECLLVFLVVIFLSTDTHTLHSYSPHYLSICQAIAFLGSWHWFEIVGREELS